MKKVLLIALFLSFSAITIAPKQAHAYNFGDFKSSTLTGKAWGAFANDDLDGVLAYTNKCLELYMKEAQKMQKELDAYPTGANDDIFAYWALNDVATSLFIQGEAYKKAGKEEEALHSYSRVVNEFSFGQAWDPQGWFWKPAEAAKEKVLMIETGSAINYGDYSSQFLTAQAWKALSQSDNASVIAYVDKVLELYGDQAKEMQGELNEYPWESKEEVFKFWALNDVGTALFIKGEAFKKDGKAKEAASAYKNLVEDFYYAQCWDPKGWFWKPAEAAREELDAMGES